MQHPARASLRRRQLKLENEEGKVSLPIEDLVTVVLDSPAIVLTSALLAGLQNHGVAVIVCNQKHHPAGLLLPYHQHSRLPQLASLQAGWSQPFRKRCWQKVVRQKIVNQAATLEYTGNSAAKRLRLLAAKVVSGDKGNLESQAAREYWPGLLGADFRRLGRDADRADFVNSALNYGYAICRAAVARAVTAHGLLACFGLHHNSDLNPFNLADDLLEPLRPVVDREVWQMAKDREQPGAGLEKEDRQRLAALAGVQVSIAGEKHSLYHAAELMAQSLVRATRKKDPGALLLPELDQEQ